MVSFAEAKDASRANTDASLTHGVESPESIIIGTRCDDLMQVLWSEDHLI